MRILIKEKLSEHKSKTPEGYLICQDAILARTGTQEYLKSEIYDDFEGEDTIVSVERKPEQVFSAEALSSFEDKPITVEHPDENVNPDNYSELAVGHTRNIRKSTFNGQEVMIGDLVITDAQTIEDIENGIRTELSCGYDCDITEGDHPEQINIRGNHIALCEQGRAGIAKIIDSKTVFDMAMSRADAMEFCMSLGKVFIEHFDKLYKDPKNDAAKHWSIEMKDKFDKVSSIILKNNNKPILDGNLRDWFFTAGANPEKYMKNPTDEELSDYDSFVTNLLQSKDFTESIKKILNDSSEIKDVEPRKGESKEDFISRFMSETKEEYPDEKQRVAVAYSYWDKGLKDSKKSLEHKDKNQLSKYFSSVSKFTSDDLSIEDIIKPIEEMGYKVTREKIDGWKEMNDGKYRKDYYFSIDGHDDLFMVSLYADGNGDWNTKEVNAYFVGRKDMDDSITQEYEMIRKENEAKYGEDFMKYVEKYLALPENSQVIENKISETYTEKRPKLLLSDLYYKEDEWNKFMVWYQKEKETEAKVAATDSVEEKATCEWCGETLPVKDMKKEKDLGMLCQKCLDELKSRGESIIIEDGYSKAFTVMYFAPFKYNDGTKDWETWTGLIYADDEMEARRKFAKYCPHCRIDRVKAGRLSNDILPIGFDTEENIGVYTGESEIEDSEISAKQYIELELSPEFTEEDDTTITAQFASEEDAERALTESALKDIGYSVISDESAYYLIFDKRDLDELIEKFDEKKEDKPKDPKAKYVIYAKGTLDKSRALFWVGDGPAKYMNESDAPTFNRAYAEKIEQSNGAYTWVKKEVKKSKVDDSETKYVIYSENGIFKGTSMDNYRAQSRDARKISVYKDFESLGQVVDYLLKYTDLKREDIVTIGDNSIGDVTVLDDNNYPDRFYEKQIKVLNKKLKKLEKENEEVKDENAMEYNRQKNNVYNEIKKQIALYEKKLQKDSIAANYDTKIRDWYLIKYPNDDIGKEIDANVTFDDLFDCLDNYRSVYKCIGVNDSVVRERCFEELAEIIGEDYSYIYDQWTKADED